MRLPSSLFLSIVLALCPVFRAQATVAVSNYFASHMVLQRGGPITVYGTGASGEAVTVGLNGSTASTTTNSSGAWSLALPVQTAGGPYTLTITGPSNTVTISDVLIGDLWLASGQSNMAFLMQPQLPYTYGVLDYQNEVNAANYPNLRVFTSAAKYQSTEAAQIVGSWSICSPSTAGAYSAIAYYFGRKLQTQTGVPIGMVVSAVGSTSITCWMDKSTAAGLGYATTGTGEFDPGNLFDAMIAPLTSIQMAGFIWYQGENDVSTASTYAARMRALIGDWRGRWSNANMPFYFIQLANYDPTLATPAGGSYNGEYGKLRLAQSAVLNTPLTGMATAADVGDPTFIHPRDKKTVGERLAAVALAANYGQNIVSTGPTYAAKAASGGSLVISYSAASLGSGLVVKSGSALTGFDVAGVDGVFYPATATITGNTVVLTCPSVPSPQDARYAWGNNPTLTLYNVEGFPALPFLTAAVPADSGNYPLQDPTTAHQDGSEGHWQFNGDGTDGSGNAHALTLANSPTFSTSDVKEGADSIVLNGTSQYGDAGTYDVGNQFTISGWVKVSTGTSNIQTILSNSSGGLATGFRFYINNYKTSDGTFVFETGNGSVILKAATATGAATPGSWQFVAVAADRTLGTARIYVDGVDRTSSAATRTDYVTSGDVRVGCMGTSGYYFTGSLDDVQISPGALTLAQVNALMIGGLSARWNFELNGGDASSHNNFLSLVGNATYAPGPAPVGSYSAALNGIGQYFSAGTQSLGSAYTISLWAKIPAGAATAQTLVANSVGGTASGFQFYVSSGNGIVFATGNGSTSATVSSAAGVFVPDGWNHVAVTVDDTSGTATLYYRGTAVPMTGAILTDAQTTGTLWLGALSDGGSSLNGNLDDVRVYSRVLTAAEVAKLAGVNANVAPVAATVSATVNAGGSVTVDALASDSDPDSGPQALSLVRITSPAGGSALIANGKIVYSPSVGFIGADTFNYTITDGLYAAMAAVNVTVLPVFSAFQSQYFTAQQLADPTVSGPAASPGGNGVTNLMAYAFNVNPWMPDLTELPVTMMRSGYLTTTYTAFRNATDIAYLVEVSGDLLNWQSGSAYTTPVSMTPLDTARQQVTVRDNVPVSAGQSRFMRVRVTQQ